MLRVLIVIASIPMLSGCYTVATKGQGMLECVNLVTAEVVEADIDSVSVSKAYRTMILIDQEGFTRTLKLSKWKCRKIET